ncbi:MAG TPA: ABC transporter ATP-binding protein [Candidatus Acidoferrales bacterium]|nr:ABC transporter ATP-binding protein [Candidatus Acidoferrales bacterium]HVC38806.1 ABC transporter ATP-binding protein [Candidatus Dormibacteraeota bacterium]
MSADPNKPGATPKGASLATEVLSAGYAGRPVVQEISIQVAPGEVVSVVGPNGSGKSTLLKALVGVVQVLSGKVLWDGKEVTNWSPDAAARAGVGYVPQIDDVFSPLTVRENLEMGGYLLPIREVAGRISHVLEVFPQLARMLTRKAGRLSGGERKMLAMGRVLMLEPRAFILDEPTANLAPALAHSLLDEHVRQLSTTGASVLVVEQRARAVLAISDRTYVLTGGRCQMEGAPADLIASPDFVDTFLGGRRLAERAEES